MWIAWAAAAAATDASDIVGRIEAKYAAVPGLEARFTQTTRSVYGDQVDKGALALMRPGRFRWDFEGDGRLYASDGTTVVAWTPADGTWMTGPAGDLASSAALGLLVSLDRLDALFTVRTVAETGSGIEVDLRPRASDGLVDRVDLSLAPDLTVRAIAVTDGLGTRTEVALSDVKLRALPLTHFQPKPPQGARIVTP
jgi:outer membrane lipoprotein-sorting protein